MLKADLFLPHQGLFQSTVTWSSSDPDIINSNGKVARPEQGKPPKNVTLSATVSLDGEQQTLGIPVNVMSESIPKPLVSYSFENNLYDNQWNHSSDKLTGRHLMAQADENIVALYQPGIKGKALYLNGTYGAILAEHLIMDDDYTISVWLKPAAFSLHTSALFWYVNWDQWLSVVPYDVNESLNIWTLKQGVYTDHSYANSLQASKWVHVTASVKGNKTRLYLNGEHVISFDTIPNLFVGHPTNLAVGINFWDKPFQGLVDELVIFHEAIGDGEARKIYGQYE
jgi:arabinan endo-1,5-alpha-L-arabinosidase